MRRFIKAVLLLTAGIVLLSVGTVWLFQDADIPHRVLVHKYGQEPSKFITLPSGAQVHYRDQGNRDGQPIVCLHGAFMALYAWEPWVRALGNDYRIITVDLPGHGLTAAVPGDDYSELGMVRFVDDFTRALKLDSFVLVGNSMGGAVAAHFTLLYPERVKKLVLVDAAGLPHEELKAPNAWEQLSPIPVVRNVLLYVSPRDWWTAGFKESVYDKSAVSPAEIEMYWELSRHEGNRAAMLKMQMGPSDEFIAEHVSEIKVPTLILWGQKDIIVPQEVGQAYHAAIAGSVLVVYKDVGHLPMMEVPEKSADDVRVFLMH